MPDTDTPRKTPNAQEAKSANSANNNKNPAPDSTQNLSKEEPELRLEPSIPTDGKDEEGERLMEQLGSERKAKEEQA
ncbi:MAG: hypothetical protein EOO29_22490 [Comamonadaceae bacterium]|nr:MAG: hypothetical protein EOO29_22490 [Comamonadaceae bacterium]